MADGNFHLLVFHHDGSGNVGNPGSESLLYLDGSTTEAAEDGVGGNAAGSMLNNEQLRIGGTGAGNDQFCCEIGFIEVHAGAESTLPGGSASAYSQSRWNRGNPVRAPEPSSAVLMGMGLAACGRRRRR